MNTSLTLAELPEFAAILADPSHESHELVLHYQDATVQELRDRLSALKVIACGKRHELERTEYKDCPQRPFNLSCGHGRRSISREEDPAGGALDLLQDVSALAALAGFPAEEVPTERLLQIGIIERLEGENGSPPPKQPTTVPARRAIDRIADLLIGIDGDAEPRFQRARGDAYRRAGRKDASNTAFMDMQPGSNAMLEPLDAQEAADRERIRAKFRTDEREIGGEALVLVRQTQARLDRWMEALGATA